MKNLLAELQRRNVTRVAMLYVVAAWLLLQVADVEISTLGLPEWSGRLVLLLLGLGLPVALVFARPTWAGVCSSPAVVPRPR